MHRVSEHTISVFSSADESKQQSTCSSYIAALEQPPGTVILLKHKPLYEKYWEPLYENSRRPQKSKNSFSLVVLAYLEEKTMKQCSPVIHALRFRGKGLTSRPAVILSLSNISIPLSAWSLFLSSADISLLCAEPSEWLSSLRYQH